MRASVSIFHHRHVSAVLLGTCLGLVLLSACGGDPGARQEALERIRRWEDTRTVAGDSLVTLLEHSHESVRAAAARALGRIGDPVALTPLVRALREESRPVVRREVAFALGILGHPDGVEPLVAQLEEETDVRTTAEMTLALGRIGRDETAPLIHPLLESPHATLREAALEALALLADSSSVGVLLEATNDPVETVVWRAAYALEKIPGPVQVDRLVELADSPSSLVRRYAVRSLGRIGATSAADHVARLIDSAGDDWHLRVRIADTLGRLGTLTPTVRGALIHLLDDPVFHVRVATLQAIGRASWIDLERAAVDLRGDAAVDVRAALLDAAVGAGFRSAPTLLQGALNDPSVHVVATALRHLGTAPVPEALERLNATLAEEDDRRLRLAAAQGLAAEPSGASVARLVALLEDPDVFVATVAAGGLGARGDDDAVGPLLEATRREDDHGHDLLLAAIQALGVIAHDDATDRLLEILRDEDDLRARLAARSALEAILDADAFGGLPTEETLRADVRPVERPPAQPSLVVRSQARQLRLETERGTIVLDLFGEDAPQMVESFALLAEGGRFDGLDFHRVVPDFVIQGGDPTGTGWGDAGYTLRSEWNRRRYERGTVGIAHSGKDTGSCQLFVTHAPQPHLDARYTIWAEVVTGMDVVDAIQRGDTFRATVVWEESADAPPE